MFRKAEPVPGAKIRMNYYFVISCPEKYEERRGRVDRRRYDAGLFGQMCRAMGLQYYLHNVALLKGFAL